jgi:uncharacterized damage-inducible protein DinB
LPDTSEYLARIHKYIEGNDPFAVQRETSSLLRELISTASEEQLTTRPNKEKWSVAEILAHLAEDEIATAWRYRQMLEHNGLMLAGFDQDLWARIGNYSSRPPQESLHLFRLLRDTNLQLLERITPEQWECFGIHSERGRITVRDLVTHMAGHDRNHVEQIREILH